MKVKTVVDEDFSNYKKPAMLIGTTRCTMKCGAELCQNHPLLKAPDIEIDDDELIQRYLDNNLTQAIVFGGLDPMDTFSDLWYFLLKLRRTYKCNDDVVIYTGYTYDELMHRKGISRILELRQFPNIIIKFGRYIPGQEPHYDEVLGVKLASDNQYAERIS